MSLSQSLLLQAPISATPCIPILPEGELHKLNHGLALGRVHQACGSARHRLALWLAAQTTGPVFWIAPKWNTEQLNPCGMMSFINPGRLILVQPKSAKDILWSMEEILRSGASPLAIADIPESPALTPVRRLHLAAEKGGKTGNSAPIGLLLTPGTEGAQGVETRWHLAPNHNGSIGTWRLHRLRARMAPEQGWYVKQEKSKKLPRVSGIIKDNNNLKA